MSRFAGPVVMFGIMLFGAGCAVNPGEDRANPGGSYPDLGTGNVAHPAVGELLVRPPAESLPSGQGSHEYLPPSYAVYDAQGSLVEKDVTGEVTLREGRYLVRVERATHEPSWFWVRVDAGKLTEVDLNRPIRGASPAGVSE